MIRNIEITVSENHKNLKISSVNRDFTSLAYFCFLNFRKIKFGNATWISIALFNSNEYPEVIVDCENRQVGVLYSVDFSFYETLSEKAKQIFQKKLLTKVFLKIFDFFKIDSALTSPLIANLNLPYEEMYLPTIKKKIDKTFKFQILLFFGLHHYEFVLEETRNKSVFRYRILKTHANPFVFQFLFAAFQVNNHLLKIGGKERGLFLIDLDERTVKVIEDRKDLLVEALTYCANIIYIGDSEVPWQP